MSTRTPRNAGNPAGNVRNAARNTTNAGTTGAATTRSPLFSAEIEVYIKLKPDVEDTLREKKRTRLSSLLPCWQGWDLDLKNDVQGRAKSTQQRHIIRAVKATIDGVLGDDNGWACELDGSLKDEELQLGPGAESRKWCMYMVILTAFFDSTC